MIFEVFMIGTFWFWALLCCATIVLFFEIVHERWFLATATIVGTVLCLQFLGDAPVFTWLYQNPVLAGAWVLGYFVAGTVWAFVKWYLYVKEKRDDYDDDKGKFLRKNGIVGTAIPEGLREEWARSRARPSTRYYQDSSLEGIVALARENDAPPNARDNKARITSWMAFWPWSFVWSLIDDFVRRAFEHIYRYIVGTLQRISEKVFAGVSDDFNVSVKKTED